MWKSHNDTQRESSREGKSCACEGALVTAGTSTRPSSTDGKHSPPAITGGINHQYNDGAGGGAGGEGGAGTGAPDGGAGSQPITKVLVKWWGLPYDACTWEYLDVHPDLPALLLRYQEWSKMSIEEASCPTENGSTAAKRAVERAEARLVQFTPHISRLFIKANLNIGCFFFKKSLCFHPYRPHVFTLGYAFLKTQSE